MSKTEFKYLKPLAIQAAKEWQAWHTEAMEYAIEKDHTATANDHLTAANRAEKCIKWLKSVNRTRFAKWFINYQTTGSMIVNEG